MTFTIDTPSALLALATSSLLVLLFYLVRFMLSTLRPANFPPGPPILPGLGNMHQIPREKLYLTWTAWAKVYGPILGVKLGPMNVVVLQRADLVRELFERRGATYAARPKMTAACDYVFPGEWDHYPGFMSIDFHRRMRRATRFHLGPGVGESLPIQRAIAGRLMHDLLKKSDAEGFTKCFHRWALSSPLAMVCGRGEEDMGKEWADRYHLTQEKWMELLAPGVALAVDIFPALGWIPPVFASWKGKAAAVRKGMGETYGVMLENAKRLANGGVAGQRFEPLMARMLRENDEKVPFSDRDISLVGGGLLDAAADTTLSTSLFFVQALAAHPDIQRRAQAEIDSLWGRETVPEDIDIGKLPYLIACVNEVIRWRPTTPQAAPRATIADDEVFGYRIPKGTIVIINVWGIHHNPDDYDRPDLYDPERFLRSPTGTKHDVGGVDMSWRKPVYTFGTGRRECPGREFALNTLLVTFALLLWAYDIVPEEEMNLNYETGVHAVAAVTPNPFRVKFVPRGEKARQGVLDEYVKANHMLADILQ